MPISECPLQYRVPPQLAPTQLHHGSRCKTLPNLRYVGYTMQMAVHAAPFTSVVLRTSVQNVFRITLGQTVLHASSSSGEANAQWQLSLQQKGSSSYCDCHEQHICSILRSSQIYKTNKQKKQIYRVESTSQPFAISITLPYWCCCSLSTYQLCYLVSFCSTLVHDISHLLWWKSRVHYSWFVLHRQDYVYPIPVLSMYITYMCIQ